MSSELRFSSLMTTTSFSGSTAMPSNVGYGSLTMRSGGRSPPMTSLPGQSAGTPESFASLRAPVWL